MTMDSCRHASRSFAVVVSKHPTEAISACDQTTSGAEFFRRIDQPIAQTLVVPFVVIEFHELVDRLPQSAFSEEDHTIQSALLDGTHKSLGIGIQIQRLRLIRTRNGPQIQRT